MHVSIGRGVEMRRGEARRAVQGAAPPCGNGKRQHVVRGTATSMGTGGGAVAHQEGSRGCARSSLRSELCCCGMACDCSVSLRPVSVPLGGRARWESTLQEAVGAKTPYAIATVQVRTVSGAVPACAYGNGRDRWTGWYTMEPVGGVVHQMQVSAPAARLAHSVACLITEAPPCHSPWQPVSGPGGEPWG